jgi:MFS family permease
LFTCVILTPAHRWGIVVALTAACTNYGGLLTVRFLLGVAEATISPAFVFITSTWYTRSEIPFRTGIWFAGNSLGGVFSSFIAFGLGHVKHPLHPWQWLFIVLGVATFLWGFVLFLFLPDTIGTASFLTPEERKLAQQRLKSSGAGTVQNIYRPAQALEAILDPKTWFIFSMSLLTQIPNSGTQNFGNLVLTGFGFTSLQSTLIILPASFISFASITGTGWLAGKFANISCYLICIVVIFPVIGSAIIYVGASKGVKLFAYYLLSTGSTALPLLLSLVGSNYKGSTKKMTITAVLFIAYCAGNIIGPQLFKTSEAPKFITAFEAIMICYALVVLLALGLRFYLVNVNRRRSRDEIMMSDVDEEGDEDSTDFAPKGFRYRL